MWRQAGSPPDANTKDEIPPVNLVANWQGNDNRQPYCGGSGRERFETPNRFFASGLEG